MKRLVTALIFLVFFFISASYALAKTDETERVNKRAEVQELKEEKEEEREEKEKEFEERKLEIEKRVEERKATKEAEVKEKRVERIKHYWELLGKRILATIERLEKLTKRIESRVAKIKETDPEADVSVIEGDLQEAKGLLADAKAKYDEATDALEGLLESEEPKGAFEQVREDIKDIKDLLTEAHRILVHTIGDIKGLRVGLTGDEPEVSPTVTLVTTPTETLTPTLTPTPIETVTPTP
jgi:hypothetical protein